MNDTRAGSCLCGGVRYEVRGPLREVIACHCGQCRKTSGHHVAATNAARSDFRLLNEETLTWYAASADARRGFCNRCGGNLFWARNGADAISIFAGTLDDTRGLAFTRHIFTRDKADYMTIPPDAEIFEGSMTG